MLDAVYISWLQFWPHDVKFNLNVFEFYKHFSGMFI